MKLNKVISIIRRMKKMIFSLLLFTIIHSPSLAQELPRSVLFGAVLGDLNDSAKVALKLSSIEGTLINRVIEGSSAHSSGFLINDVLLSLGGEKIENTDHFIRLLKKYTGGDKVRVDFFRNAKLKSNTIVFQARPKEKSNDYDIIYSSVLSGTNHLRTIITKPKRIGIFPAVLIVGGVGCYSIENNSDKYLGSVKMLTDSLAENGFVTMRVEKTGMGDSKGIPCIESDFITETQGFLDGLEKLKGLSYVDSKNTFIAGFSIGGLIAPLIAQKIPVKGIIVYGTVGRNWFEYELENTHRQKMLEGYPIDSLDHFMRAEYKRLYGLFIEKKKPEQIMNQYPDTKSNFFEYPMSIQYFQQIADINIHQLWKNTNASVLAVHGTSDYISSSQEHKLIVDIVNQYHPQNATYVEVANSDHWGLFAESEKISSSHIQSEINPLPMTIVLKWIMNKSRS